jgi:ADP-heptose:LPS heptosyltransferase
VPRLFDHDEPESVALVRLRVGLGDLLCSVPAVRALRARLPRARIVLITFEEVRPIVERLEPQVELMAFPGWPGIPERPVDEAALPRFLEHARAQRFDLALQAYGANPAANEVTAALGARRTGGFFTPGTLPDAPDLHTFVPYPQHLHEAERHLAVVEHLGAPSQGSALAFPLTAADAAEAARVRAAAGLSERPYAVIHPGATSPSRLWPAERFAAVADALAERGLAVAVTGVPGEEALTRAVTAAMRHDAADLCGETRLGGYAALLQSAAVLVANDTGSAHLAAALGVPSVTVFLSGDPVRWSYADPRHAVARVQVECNPCPHLVCPIDHRCATRVTAPAVLAAAERVLSS